MIDTIFLAERSTYRVNLLVADHGWVYLDSGRAIVCPVLLGHIEIWQNYQGRWVRGWNINPTCNVHDHQIHPVLW